MIIEILQVESNLKKEFDIFSGGKLRYIGKQSMISSHNSICLDEFKGASLYKTSENKKVFWSNQFRGILFSFVLCIIWVSFENIPFMILSALILAVIFSLFRTVKDDTEVLDNNDSHFARFFHSTRGLNGYYVVEHGENQYKVYDVSKSHYRYIMVYLGDIQIAQVEKDLHTVNNKDNYVLYLLDEDVDFANLLIMFVLYFDNYEYGNHGSAFVGQSKNWSFTWSMANKFYDSTWVDKNFKQAKRYRSV